MRVITKRGLWAGLSWILGATILSGCVELPSGVRGETVAFELELQVPEGLGVGDTVVLRADVRAPNGARVVGMDVQWDVEWEDRRPGVGAFGRLENTPGDSALLIPVAPGGATFTGALVNAGDLVTAAPDTAVSVVGFADAVYRFMTPATDTTLVTLAGIGLLIDFRHRGGGPPEFPFESPGEVRILEQTGQAGASILPNPERVRVGFQSPGEALIEIRHPDCLDPCGDTIRVIVNQVPDTMLLGYELGPSPNLGFWSTALQDTVVLSAVIQDAAGFEIRPAQGPWRLADSASAEVVQVLDSLSGELLTLRSGVARITISDSVTGLQREGQVIVRQGAEWPWTFYGLERFLVGVGARDTVFLERADWRGNRVDPVTDPVSWRLDAGNPYLSIVETTDSSAVIEAVAVEGSRQTMIFADFLQCPNRYFCETGTDRVFVYPVPVPDSVVMEFWNCTPDLGCTRAADTDDVFEVVGEVGSQVGAVRTWVYWPDVAVTAEEMDFEQSNPGVLLFGPSPFAAVTPLSFGSTQVIARVGPVADTITVTVSAPGQ